MSAVPAAGPVRSAVGALRRVALAEAPRGRPAARRQGPVQRRPRVSAAPGWSLCARRMRMPGSFDRLFCKQARRIAAWSMADLRADGVKHIPFPPLFKRADGSPMAAPPRTPLAEGKVFYAGQPVAAIVAETREQAQDAAELVQIEYEDLPCVVDPRRRSSRARRCCGTQATGNVAAEAAYGDGAELKRRSGGGARHRDRAAQPAPERDGDGAALRDRRARRRPHHALHAEPDADRCARSARRGVRRQAGGLPRW